MKYNITEIKYENKFKGDLHFRYNSHFIKLLYLKSTQLYLENHTQLLQKHSLTILEIISANKKDDQNKN